MKKFYFLLVFVMTFSLQFYVSGQNLVTNGDLEQWDDANTPTGWDLAENISQNTTQVHGGTYSAAHQSTTSSKKLRQDVQGIVGSQQYTISYWYYDNATDAKTRIWSYWMDVDGNYLDADADVLRPSTYSEDKSTWQHFEVTLIAPADAAQFRFEVRVYQQDNTSGGYVYYDDFSLEAGSTNYPEPSNYPSFFTATVSGVSIILNWMDATGEQLPSAYLILGHEGASTDFTPPVDSVPVPNDLDWSDGEVAVNVAYGEETYTFPDLTPGQDYTFTIYPYTNSGSNINYKTDGNPPIAYAQIPNVVVINQEDFESGTLGTWTAYNVTGSQVWENYEYGGNKFARMSGYEGGSNENEDWLISPQMNMTGFTTVTFNFSTAMNYTGPDLQLFFSSDYDGVGDPNNFTWIDFTDQAAWSDGSWNWVPSGDVDLTSMAAESSYVAFKYTSTADQSATWEVDDILIFGIQGVGIGENKTEKITLYPNPATEFFNFDSDDEGEMTIMDLTGRTILTSGLQKGINRVNVSQLNPGIYLVRVIYLNNKVAAGKLQIR
ncbi:MAG: DUF5017 domain-containing protein [Chlorobi bacterium]|nr:DUF5017 domain-containing protein [Chlorobiota bacterium]